MNKVLAKENVVHFVIATITDTELLGIVLGELTLRVAAHFTDGPAAAFAVTDRVTVAHSESFSEGSIAKHTVVGGVAHDC